MKENDDETRQPGDPRSNKMEELKQDRERLHQLLDDQKDDPRLARFLREYDQNYFKLMEVRGNTERLTKRVRVLRAELAVSRCKHVVVEDVYNTNDEHVASARRVTNEVYHQMLESIEHEDKMQKERDRLQKELKALSDLFFEVAMGLPKDLKEQEAEWVEKREKIAVERDEAIVEVERLREALHDNNQRITYLEKARIDAEQRIEEIKLEIERVKTQTIVETNKRDNLVQQYQLTVKQMETREQDIEEMKQRVEKTKDQFSHVQAGTRHTTIFTERVKTELQNLLHKIRNKQFEVEAQMLRVQEAEQAIKEMLDERDVKLKEMASKQQQLDHLNKVCIAIRRKIALCEEKKAGILKKKEKQKKQCLLLQEEMEKVKKTNEAATKERAALLRQRDNLRKQLLRETAVMQKEAQIHKLHALANKRLKQDNNELRYQGEEKKRFAKRMMGEWNKYQQKVQAMAHKIINTTEDERRATELGFDLMRTIALEEMKMLEIQNMYEATRAEHAVSVRTILHLHNLLNYQKERVQNMSYDTFKMVQERDYRDELLLQEQLAMQRLHRQIMLLKEQLSDKKASNSRLKVIVENQDADEKKLIRIKRIADNEYKREAAGLQRVIMDCENLNMALIKRHYDLQDMYEVSKLKQSLLYKGENMFRNRMHERAVLIAELTKTMARRRVDQKYRDQVEELRLDVEYLKELLKSSNNRSKGLIDELSHPRTIHRWRNLLARDPAMYESLRHVHKLRRDILEMDEKIEETTQQIHEMDHEYLTFRVIVLAQPSPDTVLQLKKYREDLTCYYENIKALTADLTSAIAEKKDCTTRCRLVRRKFFHLRKTWLQQKKKEQRRKDQERDNKPAVFTLQPGPYVEPLSPRSAPSPVVSISKIPGQGEQSPVISMGPMPTPCPSEQDSHKSDVIHR